MSVRIARLAMATHDTRCSLVQRILRDMQHDVNIAPIKEKPIAGSHIVLAADADRGARVIDEISAEAGQRVAGGNRQQARLLRRDANGLDEPTSRMGRMTTAHAKYVEPIGALR